MYELAVLFGLILYLSQAFMDVVVDGLMVMESRKDPKQGSIDLQTYSWAMFGVGGTLFGTLGGFLLQHTSANVIFFVTAVLGLILGISGFALDSKLEHSSHEIIQMSLCSRIQMNMSQIREGFTIRELRNTILFMFFFASVVPNFGDYMYYFYMDELKFSKLEYSLLSVIGNVLLLLVVLAYNLLFAQTDVRWLLAMACVINCVGSLNGYFLVNGVTFGLSPYLFTLLASVTMEAIYSGLFLMPG